MEQLLRHLKQKWYKATKNEDYQLRLSEIRKLGENFKNLENKLEHRLDLNKTRILLQEKEIRELRFDSTKEVEELKSILAKKSEKTIEEKDQRIKSLENDVKKMTASIENNKNANANLLEIIDQKNEDYDSLTAEIARLKSQNQNCLDQISEEQSRGLRLSAKIDSVTEKLRLYQNARPKMMTYSDSDRFRGAGFYFGPDERTVRKYLDSISTYTHPFIFEKLKEGARQINLKFNWEFGFDQNHHGWRIRSPKLGTEDRSLPSGAIWELFITNRKGSARFRAIVENINPTNGEITSKEENVLSVSKKDAQYASAKFVGTAGYVRWNIEFLD